ncbi:MAG: COX aromatic rich motif-containing protein [Pseudomonadota bacterium]|nr:COX aromatic rich motif-containing protein [Pseudomonadota bacterium]
MSPVGPIGASEKTILLDSLAIMLAIIVPTIVATLAVAWWFRASNGRARRRPEWAFSGQIELVVWAIPLMTILLLGGVTWIGSHALDPRKPIATDGPTLHVQVVALDWKWLFIYPDQRVATVNELVVPTGVPVRFSITSASVMNTFFVPRLGSMIYAMNGMATELNLRADQAGSVMGLSTMLSGEGFSDMHFEVRALAAGEFDAWLDTTRRAGGTLDSARYMALARQSVEDRRMGFGSVEPGLFDRVVDQSLPPGPGPGLKNPGAANPVTARRPQ